MGGLGKMKVGWCLLVIAMVAAGDVAEAALSCGQVLSSVSSCVGYFQRGGAVSGPCCDGVKSLKRAASTVADRQAVCGCVKTLAPSIGARPENINALVAKCAPDLPYRYSPSLDCSKVK